jgi:hypothetical protein
MDRRFWRLGQFLGGYLHEDWPQAYGTPEKAIEQAIEEYPLDLRQQVRRDLHAVLSEITDDKELREVLIWGLGVYVHFKEPRDARAFGEDVESRLRASIKDQFEAPIDRC